MPASPTGCWGKRKSSVASAEGAAEEGAAAEEEASVDTVAGLPVLSYKHSQLELLAELLLAASPLLLLLLLLLPVLAALRAPKAVDGAVFAAPAPAATAAAAALLPLPLTATFSSPAVT